MKIPLVPRQRLTLAVMKQCSQSMHVDITSSHRVNKADMEVTCQSALARQTYSGAGARRSSISPRATLPACRTTRSWVRGFPGPARLRWSPGGDGHRADAAVAGIDAISPHCLRSAPWVTARRGIPEPEPGGGAAGCAVPQTDLHAHLDLLAEQQPRFERQMARTVLGTEHRTEGSALVPNYGG